MSEARTTLTVNGVLFDMDGTLVDSTSVVEIVWSAFAVRHGAEPAELLAFAHGRRASETIAVYGTPGIDVDLEVTSLIAEEMSMTEGIVEIPGAAAFVASLPSAVVGLVTSAPGELARARMGVVGIPIPPVIVAAEDVTSGKPDPQGYLAAAARLGLEPADVVVFEDADAGLRAGVAAGMQVVVVGDYAGEITDGLPRIPDYRAVTVTAGPGGALTVVL
ncbi:MULTISPECIES: HAD-IA family hydrolase [unclassified Plantibacter]|uniref:HAD-IA family hydrolase n=1 Tax=unclassified Plantibacter TaxID=2624265 RepID=UPI003D32E0D8